MPFAQQWTDWPILNGDDIHLWFKLYQLWDAAQERFKAATGGAYWPPETAIWEFGTVTGVASDATTISDGTKTWTLPADGWQNPWYGVGNGFSPDISWAPSSWAVSIEVCGDPRQDIFVEISTWNSTTLTVTGLRTELSIRDLQPSDLVGRRYKITRSKFENGIAWYQRVLEWPNDYYWITGHKSASTNTTITDSTLSLTTNLWAGKDILGYDAGGNLRRASITSNTATVITHGGTWTAQDEYWIVNNGAYFDPIRDPLACFAWYRGALQSYQSHDCLDEMNGFFIAQADMVVDVGEPPDCTPTTIFLLDNDYHSDSANQCGPPDKFYAKDIHKTIRAIQVFIETYLPYFVPVRDYDFADYIPNFTTATFMAALGVSSTSGTSSGHDASGLFVSLSVPFTPITVYWTIKKANGDNLLSGSNTYNGTQILGDIFNDAIYDGKTVVAHYSDGVGAGWNRSVEREFKYFHPKVFFRPDVSEELPETAFDPPSEPIAPATRGPGDWVTKPASIGYTIRSSLGLCLDGTGELFRTGDLARYRCDNFADLTLGAIDPDSASIPYFDHAFTGNRRKAIQDAINASRSGTITGGSHRHLETSKNWWNGDFYSGGVMITHTGTGTAGSSTTQLVDSSKSGSAFWGADSGGRWVGFVVEVEVSAGVWERRVITAHSGTTLTFSHALSATSLAKNWKIREPKYVLNAWAGRTVTITKADNSTVDLTCTHSDDSFLYFADPGFDLATASSFSIFEPQPQTVWKWNGSKWVVPTGIDPRTGENYPSDTTKIQPTVVQKTGRMECDDLITPGLLNQLYSAMNLMLWTKAGTGWTSRFDPAVVEYNVHFGFEEGPEWVDPTPHPNGSDIMWDSTSPPPFHLPYAEQDNYPPHCYSDTYIGNTSGSDLYRNYAWGTLGGIPNGGFCSIACEVDWFDLAAIYSSDPDEQDNYPGHGTQNVDGNWYSYKFDANGDPFITFRKWRRYSSTGPSTATSRKSGNYLGRTDPKPNWCRDPIPPFNPPDGPQIVYQGYEVIGGIAIMKWNTTGGFKYLPEATEWWFWL